MSIIIKNTFILWKNMENYRMSSSLIVSIPNKTCIHVNPLYQALQELREKLGGKKKVPKTFAMFSWRKEVLFIFTW